MKAITFDPVIRAQLQALAAQYGISFSRAMEAVLTRQLELPLATP